MRYGHEMFLCVAFASLQACAAVPAWVQAGVNTNAPVWGWRQGLLWGIPRAGVPPDAPRGLIRVGYPVLAGGRYDLINFIAIEPVVNRRRGFSELETSQLDHVPGKRIWPDSGGKSGPSDTNLVPGEITSLSKGVEQLEVTLRVERFLNGAHVRLVIRQRADCPDEIELYVHAEPDSAPLDYCILTATMGNKARARQLWLRTEVVSSPVLYPDYQKSGFTPHTMFPLARLHRTPDGGVLVAMTTDEEHPEKIRPFADSWHWYYGGTKVTQYWRQPAGGFHEDLQVAVNARYTYWRSQQPIPGGVAFENFELRERFRAGQQSIFGITRQTPPELGFTARPPTGSSPR